MQLPKMGWSRRAIGTMTLGALAVAGSLYAYSTTAADKPKVALIQINQQALFFNQMNDGAKKAAEKLGAELVIFDANNDPAAQSNAMETYTQQKVGAIIVAAIDVNGIKPAISAAKAAGIPVIAVDAVIPEGDNAVQVGVDNYAAGKEIGEYFVKYVADNMGGKANVGIVGALNSAIQNQRLDGFKEALVANSAIAVLDTVDGRNIQDNAMTAAENLATANPNMDVVYATGEPALVGTASAISAQGKTGSVKVFGWDLTAQIVKGIDEGWIVGIVQQDPHAEGEKSVEAAVTLIGGGQVEKNINVPITIVDKSNVDQFRAMFQ